VACRGGDIAVLAARFDQSQRVADAVADDGRRAVIVEHRPCAEHHVVIVAVQLDGRTAGAADFAAIDQRVAIVEPHARPNRGPNRSRGGVVDMNGAAAIVPDTGEVAVNRSGVLDQRIAALADQDRGTVCRVALARNDRRAGPIGDDNIAAGCQLDAVGRVANVARGAAVQRAVVIDRAARRAAIVDGVTDR